MKNLFYIATILYLLSCDNSNKEIKDTGNKEKQEESISIESELPNWLIEIYPDTIDGDYFSTSKKVTQFIKLNDSISYCIYKETDGVCLNHHLVVFINQVEAHSYLIEEGCDHDQSFANYSWSEYKIVDDFNVESTTYYENFHDSIIDKEGMFKVGKSFENSTLLYDTLTTAYQILNTGEIKISKRPLEEQSSQEELDVLEIQWDSISQNDKDNLTMYWEEFKTNLENDDIEKLMSQFKFPLEGEWGFVMGHKKEGEDLTKEDFKDGYKMIFTERVTEQLLMKDISKMYLLPNSKDGSVEEFRTGVEIGSGEFESGRFFNFCKTGEVFKLCLIWHAG